MVPQATRLIPEQPCPACGRHNRMGARYCARCGHALDLSLPPRGTPGRTPHPRALASPPGFEPCLDAEDLYVAWRHGAQGPTLGAEALVIDVFNAGHDLRDVRLRLVGMGAAGEMLCNVEQDIRILVRGATVRIEVPSYELSTEITRLIASLASAEWPDESMDPQV